MDILNNAKSFIGEGIQSLSNDLEETKEYYYYYLRSHKYCEIRDDLQDYYDKLIEYKKSINTKISEFEEVTASNCNFYGEVCSNYITRSKEMYDELKDLLTDIENQCSVIQDNITKANTVAQNYIDTYTAMKEKDSNSN